jgi:hypothetical protein
VKCVRLGGVALAALLLASDAVAQVYTYQTGQDMSPAYEGWKENPDGSFNLIFGYMNRNWGEELDIPIGESNFFSPGPEDRGQPTHFYPRRNRFVFEVRVPADFGDQELVWTVDVRGSTERAYASLRTDYKLDHMVVMSETGALGIGVSDSIMRSNAPPSVTLVGEPVRRVGVGQPVTLVTRVTDDGIPRIPRRPPPRAREGPPQLPPAALRPPGRITVDKELGLHLAWFVLRGGSEVVTFDPPQIKTWEDTRAGANSPWAPLWRTPEVPENGEYTVEVTFDRPGTYVLRGRADDGGLYDDTEVTIIVAPVSD